MENYIVIILLTVMAIKQVFQKTNYSKAGPGGNVQMHHSQRIINNLICFILNLFLLFAITTSSVSASGIPTQTATKILQIGNADELALPSDVAVYANKVYVVDGSHHRVMVYDLQGNFLFQFGGKGKQHGQMNYPVGIDVAHNGQVYVADSGNNRIQRFSGKGVYLSSFPVKIGNKVIRPIDLIYHSRTGNIVVSGNNHQLMTFSSKGKLLKKWGRNGVNQGDFRYPATISELSDGRIAVVDVLNSRVQVFNTDGTISLVVGDWGVLPGQLFRPKGIAIDKSGNFYISDSYINVVQKFSDSGEFIAVLGNNNKPYNMLTPVGMTIHKNKLYVVEMRKHRVSIYQLVN